MRSSQHVLAASVAKDASTVYFYNDRLQLLKSLKWLLSSSNVYYLSATDTSVFDWLDIFMTFIQIHVSK